MVVLIRRRRRCRRTALLENALSPNRCPGVVRGRPRPRRRMRIPAITGSKPIESCRCPAVVMREIGRARRSAARTILLVKPPRDRPSASRCDPEFVSFDPAPCVQFRRQAVTGTGRVLMGPYHGAIHRDRPIHALLPVTAAPQLSEDLRPHPLDRPAAMPVVDRLPVPAAVGQIPPCRP